jgi:hypothetical protein
VEDGESLSTPGNTEAMGAVQASETFPFFGFKLTPSVDEVEAEDAREAEERKRSDEAEKERK